MATKRPFIVLMGLMVIGSFAVLVVAITVLYHAAVREQRQRLEEFVHSQARHIEAMFRFAAENPSGGDPVRQTLDQLIDAHEHQRGFGRTGEFALARRQENKIVFLLSHRHDLDQPKPVDLDAPLAQPMRLALRGDCGSTIGLDYRGVTVLAAYESVKNMHLGVVAKIDMAEIREPFIRASLIAGLLTVFLVGVLMLLFRKTAAPVLDRLSSDKRALEKSNHGLMLEIQQRTRAENELKRSEGLRRVLVQYAQDAIFLFDGEDGRILEANRSAMRMTGRTLEELQQLYSWHLFSEEEAVIARQRRAMLLKRKETPLQEYHIVAKDGRRTPVEAKANMIELHDRKLVIGIYRNIEERLLAEQKRKDLEAQLQQSQKMEAIGRLAGGVAHDFNNLLSIILGYSELELGGLEPDSRHLEALMEIHRAADRAQGLTRQLLAFGRKQMLQMKILDINQVVQGFAKLLKRVIGEDVVLKLALSPDRCCVKADISQLEQILMNLAVNARDAMPDGGMLTIETAMVHLDRNYADQRPEVTPGPYSMLGVTDTGEGMEQSTLAQIFEPFFTTKDLEKGTGLGLSTVYGIVKQHGGNIWVYSEKGQGTTFKIYLPLAEDAPECSILPVSDAERQKSSALIMVVEDDPALRELVRTILQQNGYGCITPDGALHAVEIARDQNTSIDLLVTDVIMPELKGPEVYRRVAAFQPGIKVLFMSGYTDNVIAHQGILSEGTHFLQKPFTAKALAMKIRSVLEDG